jgi:hypothetical protein
VLLAKKTEDLLALVDADRARKCEAILGEARGRVAALLAEAHADARKRMRQMFRDERERKEQRVASANARLQTRVRLAEQQRAAAYLAAGWQKLPVELLRRWRAGDARGAWVASVVANARAVLPCAAWRIVHAPDWPAVERDELAVELTRVLGAAPAFVADAGIRAGLKIAADGNVVDGTLTGLLADRSEIGALLLHELEES